MPIKDFKDSLDSPEKAMPKGKIYGEEFLPKTLSTKIGAGDTVFCADISGIWLGAKTFALAPFSVDMEGDLIASSVTITGGTITGTTISEYLALAGGTMVGDLILDHAPVLDLEASTKKYVDDEITAVEGSVDDLLPSIVCNENEVMCNNDEVMYN